jgi:hypothetical protein
MYYITTINCNFQTLYLERSENDVCLVGKTHSPDDKPRTRLSCGDSVNWRLG